MPLSTGHAPRARLRRRMQVRKAVRHHARQLRDDGVKPARKTLDSVPGFQGVLLDAS